MSYYCPFCKCMDCYKENERLDKEVRAAGGPEAYFRAKSAEIFDKFFANNYGATEVEAINK